MQVVTCSGVHADGSLRIVRNGIGMIEQATVELSGEDSLSTMALRMSIRCASSCMLTHSRTAGMRGIWSLKATSMDAFDTFLVLTFVGETRILAINSDDELDEAEIEGFDSEAQVRGCPVDFETTRKPLHSSHHLLIFVCLMTCRCSSCPLL